MVYFQTTERPAMHEGKQKFSISVQNMLIEKEKKMQVKSRKRHAHWAFFLFPKGEPQEARNQWSVWQNCQLFFLKETSFHSDMTIFFWNWCLQFDYPLFQTTQPILEVFYFLFFILWLLPICDSDILSSRPKQYEEGCCCFFHMKGEKRTDFYTYIVTYEQTKRVARKNVKLEK